MMWEHHNQRIIVSMGMAWDTGAPMWPFQTPEILLALLNAPAYLLAAPVFAALGLRTVDELNPVLLLTILLLWFCCGRRMDFGLIPQRWGGRGRWLPAILLGTAVASLFAAIYLLVEGMTWWSEYGGLSVSGLLILARSVAPLPWCFLLAFLSTWGLLRHRIDNSRGTPSTAGIVG
jgi:hypothetical protein